ncbi:hypothetical protein DFH09DRAFT_1198284 [Mycena vulgaris]|nr:hypothetical protein DFH09DRAFT_1198284 [Mycena vulgaris]
MTSASEHIELRARPWYVTILAPLLLLHLVNSFVEHIQDTDHDTSSSAYVPVTLASSIAPDHIELCRSISPQFQSLNPCADHPEHGHDHLQ